MNSVPSTPPPSQLIPGAVAPAAKTWKVGTLTYTTAGVALLFFWLLLGDFVWSMRERSVGPMAHWYLNHLNVPSVVFGLLLSSFPALVSFILMPVIGVKSDNHRGKWGRRIPFLLVTTPLAALGMIGLAVSPIVARWVHSHFPDQSEMVVSVVCFGVFWAAFELATIAGGAVFGGLINDVVPKELLGRFYGLFRAVSLIDGMIFNYWIMGKVPEYFTLIMAVVGVVYGIAFTWVCLKVKEGDYPPPPPRTAATTGLAVGFFRGSKAYFRECFSKPYYLQVFAMMMAAFLAFGPINIFAIPYARSLGVDMDTYGKYLALTFLISLCLSFFIGWLVDKFHPLRMTMAALLGYAVVALLGRLYATTPDTFLAAWVAHGVLAGCFFTSVASLGQRLFPREKFAQYASASAMVMAPANMVLAPAVGLVLDRTGKVYHHTFTAGCALAVVALVLALCVHHKFMKLGGPKHYVAPV
ncbi:MAG: transporter [Rariglobus sp.]|jgi:MFS family permease|nr:transporter [Rariglobus sp.]